VTELKDMIDEQFTIGGGGRVGRTLITHSGLKAEKMAMTGREMMIAEVSRGAREKLITAYDLSEGKLGLVRDVNRANMEALNETFINECLRPKCMMIEEEIEVFLLPRYDKGLTCDFELPDFEDKEFKLKERKQNLETGFHTINQELAMEGEEPVAWGDAPWFSGTMVQYGSEPATPPLPPPKKDIEKEQKKIDSDYWTDDKKETAWKLFVQEVDKYKDIILEPMKHYFKQQEEQVIDKLMSEGKKIIGAYAGWSKAKAEEHIARNKTYDKINIDQEAEKERLKELFTPLVKSIMQQAGDARIARLYDMRKTIIGYNVNDPKTLKWLGERMDLFSDSVSGTTFQEIDQVLRNGFSAGYSTSKIADMLREKFDSWEEFRAPLIAQTETISAMNMADLLSVKQAGLEEEVLKCWLSARDSHVRPSHTRADAGYSKGIPVDDMFVIDGDNMLAPGTGSNPAENINCRCTLIYVEK
jgi:hypothetical protein